MVMNIVPTRIWENGCEYSANKYMREWLWIECQKVYERMAMDRLPTSIWENGYEQCANKYMSGW